MLNADPDFDLLSAYVDGELPVAIAAELAARLSREPDLAARLAKVAALKQAVASLTDDTVVLVAAERRPRPHPAVSALAACLVLFALLTGLYVVSGTNASLQPGERTVADALKTYDGFATPTGTAPRIEPSSAPFLVPSLDGAGLFLIGTSRDVTIDGRHATHAAFMGPHGCRLSLFSWPEAGSDEALKLALDRTADIARWRVEGNAYLLVSRHMNEQRFVVVARAARDIMARRLTAAADTNTALETAHQPCIAEG